MKRAKNGPQAIGRSRSSLTSNLHAVADARGRFIRGCLTLGQCHDVPQALPLLGNQAPAYFIADRGYDADSLVVALAARGTCAMIPPRRKRCQPRAYDPMRYAQRQHIKRLFNRLKQFRCVVTRYDKLDTHFLASIHFAPTVLWLRDC